MSLATDGLGCAWKYIPFYNSKYCKVVVLCFDMKCCPETQVVICKQSRNTMTQESCIVLVWSKEIEGPLPRIKSHIPVGLNVIVAFLSLISISSWTGPPRSLLWRHHYHQLPFPIVT